MKSNKFQESHFFCNEAELKDEFTYAAVQKHIRTNHECDSCGVNALVHQEQWNMPTQWLELSLADPIFQKQFSGNFKGKNLWCQNSAAPPLDQNPGPDPGYPQPQKFRRSLSCRVGERQAVLWRPPHALWCGGDDLFGGLRDGLAHHWRNQLQPIFSHLPPKPLHQVEFLLSCIFSLSVFRVFSASSSVGESSIEQCENGKETSGEKQNQIQFTLASMSRLFFSAFSHWGTIFWCAHFSGSLHFACVSQESLDGRKTCKTVQNSLCFQCQIHTTGCKCILMEPFCFSYDYKIMECLWNRAHSRSFTLFFSLVVVATPIAVIGFSYYRIFKKFSDSKRKAQVQWPKSVSRFFVEGHMVLSLWDTVTKGGSWLEEKDGGRGLVHPHGAKEAKSPNLFYPVSELRLFSEGFHHQSDDSHLWPWIPTSKLWKHNNRISMKIAEYSQDKR